MKKRLLGIFAAIILIISLVVPVAAETYESDNDMNVTFTIENGKGKMESDFHGGRNKNTIDDFLSEYLQPGDTGVFHINLKNASSKETDWWMENRIIHSLEDRSNDVNTKGGGYEYYLYYTNSKGERNTLFSSSNIGGDDTTAGIGLWEATYGLQLSDDENFFYLDTFKGGQGGEITLEVTLDGETQGNDYQDTLADLGMNFAVELTSPEPTTTSTETTTTPQRTTTPNNVKTGDQSNALTYFIILGIAGVIILVFAIVMFKRRRKENES